MPAYVIDTNVGIVANGKNCPQADETCVLTCINKLRECVDILKGEKPGFIVIDDGNEILTEYQRHLSFSGQPGTGDMFFKELFQRQATAFCERVKVHKDDASWEYEEFPHASELTSFDRSDRKFVAVALVSRNQPIILNAVDKDWFDYQVQLEEYNLRIQQLCPHCLRDNH